MTDGSIIISTGRCGSTLLSDLIAQEAGTLSVQEFCTPAARWHQRNEVITGLMYWATLSSPRADLATLIRLGLPPKEFHYPSTGRWAHNLPELPQVLAVTLPKISEDPDALFEHLAQRVPAFPTQPFNAHQKMFLDLLTVLTGRRRWVERSGGSCFIATCLLQAFPAAKVVHLTRNWEDTAQSMSRHPFFQLFQLRVEFLRRCGVDPFQIQSGQTIPEDLRPLLPDRLTVAALQERGKDIRRYLTLCAFFHNQAEQALADNPPQHLLTMRYEDIVRDPVTELSTLGRFLEFDDSSGWANRVAHKVARPVLN